MNEDKLSFLQWGIAATMAAGVLLVGWLAFETATNAGPNCPAPVDPQWLGYCDDPEAQTQ